ncbi:MAG: hypothetical protein ACLFUG_03350 [Nitriliruptoraceae bacterium]
MRESECVLRGGPCRGDDPCPIHEPWARARLAFRDSLAVTTFAQVAVVDGEVDDVAHA